MPSKLPKKWKKIGNILVADFSQINTNNLSQVSQIYANILKVKTVLQKNKVNGELRKPKRTEILFGEDTETEITEYAHLRASGIDSEVIWRISDKKSPTLFQYQLYQDAHAHRM